MDDIYEVGILEAHLISKHKSPLCRYWTQKDMKYVAIDNTKGQALTKEFDGKDEMLKWLKGERL